MTISQIILASSLACIVLAVMTTVVIFIRERAYWRGLLKDQQAKRAALVHRFSKIVDADAEAHRVVAEASDKAINLVSAAQADATEREETSRKLLASMQAQVDATAANLEDLRRSYQLKIGIHDRLVKQVAIFDEQLAFAEMGLYEPHFDFDTSEQFKAAIERVRAQQKAMISSKTAVVCHETWTVQGSASKGKTMVDRSVRLTLRAFNSECDAAVANTRWNNANAMERRIENARAQIDKHNASLEVEITEQYYRLKLDELRLTHEYREKIKAEREERADLARAAREEQKLQRDMERAEEEEAKYQRLLNKAQAEAARAMGPRLDAFNQQIEMLQRDLAEAHAKVERARAMAEMTRTGYVYVISNLGSFGPDFVKIGLTRRLDPADRIRELGDASVPFLFDTHAMIYSDDAPTLERALHAEFATQRVNATNMRKEFFRVSIEDVEGAVRRLAPTANFFRDIEAQEYHETMALRNAQLAQQTLTEEQTFPASI